MSILRWIIRAAFIIALGSFVCTGAARAFVAPPGSQSSMGGGLISFVHDGHCEFLSRSVGLAGLGGVDAATVSLETFTAGRMGAAARGRASSASDGPPVVSSLGALGAAADACFIGVAVTSVVTPGLDFSSTGLLELEFVGTLRPGFVGTGALAGIETTPGQVRVRTAVTGGVNGLPLLSVTFQAHNSAPTADAATAQTVNEAVSVTLDGSGSSDPDGDNLTYAWTQTSGPTVALSSAAAASPSFTAPTLTDNTPVTLTFSLIVNDGTVDSTADIVTITVNNLKGLAIIMRFLLRIGTVASIADTVTDYGQ